MREFINRIVEAKGDSTQQVIDLILFIGYFSICLYAGGVAYESSYNNYFSLQSPINPKDSYLAVSFVINVLSTNWYWVPSSLYILVFIFLYYSCRYAWKPWFGYFVLSLLLYTTFLTCGALGEHKGKNDAIKDGLKESTTLPVVKLYGPSGAAIYYAGGNFHLLAIDKDNFYIFEPAGVEGSIIQVNVVQKQDIQRYEVTVK